jgi:predicted peptidase
MYTGSASRAAVPAEVTRRIWNFHGACDDVEPVASSREMIAAIRKAGGQPRYTEYPDLGHTVFAWAYTEPALVEWLFEQRR